MSFIPHDRTHLYHQYRLKHVLAQLINHTTPLLPQLDRSRLDLQGTFAFDIDSTEDSIDDLGSSGIDTSVVTHDERTQLEKGVLPVVILFESTGKTGGSFGMKSRGCLRTKVEAEHGHVGQRSRRCNRLG